MNKYKRKTPSLELRDKVLVLCGGKTEEIYFNKFKQKYRSGLKNVTVKITTCKYSNPIAIVDEAISLQNDFDEIWCVFDKDDFKDFDEAIRKSARYPKVNCAFSNEAVEYWFTLYFSNKTGPINRKKLNEMISKQFDVEYDKSNTIIERVCERLSGLNIQTAEERAKRGYEYHELNSGKSYSDWCSCTSVFMLTKRLRKWNEAKK